MHTPAYAHELLQLRRAGLAPEFDQVVITNCWRLAKLVRQAECIALVVRDRDEPDLRCCYGMLVQVALSQCGRLASSSNIPRPSARGTPIPAYLSAIRMAEHGPPHELEALANLVEPIAQACVAANSRSATIYDYSEMLTVWKISVDQVARQKAKAKP